MFILFVMPPPDTVESSAADRRKQRNAERYDAIMKAGTELFAERGYHGTAVPMVAEHAGMSTGSIYRYFPSKDALVNAIFRHHKQAIAAVVYGRLNPVAPPREQFRAMWNAMAEFALAEPRAFAFLELHHHASYLDEESQKVENALKDFAAGFVRMAQQTDVFKPMETTLLMELMFGAFVGMMRAHYEGRVKLDPQLIADAESACWDAVTNHP